MPRTYPLVALRGEGQHLLRPDGQPPCGHHGGILHVEVLLHGPVAVVALEDRVAELVVILRHLFGQVAAHGVLFGCGEVEHVLDPRREDVAPLPLLLRRKVVPTLQDLQSLLQVEAQPVEKPLDKRSCAHLDERLKSRIPRCAVRPAVQQTRESVVKQKIFLFLPLGGCRRRSRERSCGHHLAPRIKFTTSRAPRPCP